MEAYIQDCINLLGIEVEFCMFYPSTNSFMIKLGVTIFNEFLASGIVKRERDKKNKYIEEIQKLNTSTTI